MEESTGFLLPNLLVSACVDGTITVLRLTLNRFLLVGVHSFMYEALLSLVVVHAQISEIAPPLVFRALSALLINMAQDCLRCFQQVERFGMGGMLQATLEMEFMNHTLSQYKSPSSDEILQMIYAAVDRAYQPEGGENLQNEMAGLKKLLLDARHATQVQFLCFKKPK